MSDDSHALVDVGRVVRRSRQYFLEDGLWDVAAGLWLALTLALPALIGGREAVANSAPLWMLSTSLVVRPAVLAAKKGWVFPRTGHVTYPEPGAPPGRSTLGLGPGRGHVVSGPSRVRLDPFLAAGTTAAVAIPLTVRWGLPHGEARFAVFHVAVGLTLGGAFLFASWRWGQRRWIAVGLALVALGLLVAMSRLDGSAKLALHTTGIAMTLLASGAFAFAHYLRHAPKAGAEADGR